MLKEREAKHFERFGEAGERIVMTNNVDSERNGSRETAFERAGALANYLDRHLDRIKSIVASRTSAKLSQGVSDEDLAHEVILEAMQHRETFAYQGKTRFIRWVSTLARRVVCDAAHVHGRAPQLLSIRNNGATERDVRPSHIAGQTRTPSSIVARDERCRQVREVLKSLPEKDRTVIRMVKLEERSLKEVPAAMGCSRNAVAKRLGRALGRLGAKLAPGCHDQDRRDYG